MSIESHTSRGVLIRLEMCEDIVIIRCGKILVFGGITPKERAWIEDMVDNLSLEETVNKIFRRIRTIQTVA